MRRLLCLAFLATALGGLTPSAEAQSPGRFQVVVAPRQPGSTGMDAILVDTATGQTWLLGSGNSPGWAPLRYVLPGDRRTLLPPSTMQLDAPGR